MRLSNEHNDMGYRGMSDVMLFGVLRMPPELWSGDPIDVAQRHSRYLQAADLILELQAENAKIRKQMAFMEETMTETGALLDASQAQVDALIEAARIRRETPLTEKEILSIIYSIGKPDDSLQKALTYEKGPYSVDCVTEKAMKFAAAIHATLLPPLPTTPDKQAD